MAKNAQPAYQMAPYYSQANYAPTPFKFDDVDKDNSKKLEKKEGVIEKTIGKIIDKVIKKVQIALPTIIQKLLGLGFEFSEKGLTKSSVVGLLDFLPMFLMNIFSRLSNFIDVLKKNKFLKSFLVPALVVVAVAGSVIFLVWFLQSDTHQNYENTYYDDYRGYKTSSTYQKDAPYAQDARPNPLRSFINNKYDGYYNANSSPNQMYIPRNNYLGNRYAVT